MIDARRVTMRGLSLMFVACVLLSCVAEAPGRGDSGVAGMDGGGMDARVDSGGGSGGTDDDAATDDDAGGSACLSDMDLRTGAQCGEKAEGYFAIKLVHDVWWAGVPTRDPGRGKIELFALAKVDSVCSDGSAGVSTIKACGMQLPVFTSDVNCEAYQLEIPDSAWESTRMPRLTAEWRATGFASSALWDFGTTTGLFGIDLQNEARDVAWPTPREAAMVRCSAGTGLDCLVDHDADGSPGITVTVRDDATVYSYSTPSESGIAQADTDTHYGQCSYGNAFQHRGMPTIADISAGGGPFNPPRATTLQVGLRARFGGGGVIASDCVSGTEETPAATFESRALTCAVDPATLPPPHGLTHDERHETGDYTCFPYEALFVDDNLPVYRALSAGEVPGESAAPNGWVRVGRDIDRSPSSGSKSAFVRLGALTAAEPTCATVRNVVFPEL